MKKLYNFKKLSASLDRSKVGISVALLKEQILQAHREFPKKDQLPRKKWSSVVFCGMGGSALGADVLRSLYEPYLTVPFTIVNGYSLPCSANKGALVVLCSYSGTTEEILSCLAEARERKVSSFVIAEGGALITAAKKFRIPHFAFKTDNNPSKQPRIGTGYTMTGLYLLLKQQGLFAKGAPDLVAATKKMDIDTAVPNRFATELHGKSCVIIAAEHLRGNAHILSNQLNESAKVFAPYFSISELNHHLLEGLGSLEAARKHWIFIFMESKNYAPRISKRFGITRAVIEKQGFTTKSISFTGTRTVEVLKMLSFSSWLSYYLALLGKKNPSAIPWVDYFKKRLA